MTAGPADATLRARRLVVAGCGLPGRWQRRDDFTVLETGFGRGDGVLATWLAWREDPLRCNRLHVVALAAHPPTAGQLRRDHAGSALAAVAGLLADAWPPLAPGVHAIDLESGRFRLLLAIGDIARLPGSLRLAADAVLHDGGIGAGAAVPGSGAAADPVTGRPTDPDTGSPDGSRIGSRLVPLIDGLTDPPVDRLTDPGTHSVIDRPPDPLTGPPGDAIPDGTPLRLLAKAIARLCAPGAVLAAIDATDVDRAALRSAGFTVDAVVDGDGAGPPLSRAIHAPRHASQPSSARLPAVASRPRRDDAVVIGAGVAGAASARALAALGVAVTVIDRHAEPAGETSGNVAGLFHGTIDAADGRYARLFRAAALVAGRDYAAAVATGVAGCVDGLLRLQAPEADLAAMAALIDRLRLPADYIEAVDSGRASRLAGVPLAVPAWFYRGGGWISPRDWARQTIAGDGIRHVGDTEVAAVERDGDRWRLNDAAGRRLATARIVVLANAADAARLLAPAGDPAWPLRHLRGQVTQWTPSAAPAPRLALPLAGGGYALSLPDGSLMCGATREPGSPGTDGEPTAAGHRANLQALQRLTGIDTTGDAGTLRGRVGWRLQAADRLPVAGAVPLVGAASPTGRRLDQARWLPRQPGLFVLTALGSRGLTLAPLLGRLVAAMATSTPWPVERDLADAVDPGRWIVRATRSAVDRRPASAPSRAASRVVLPDQAG